MRNKVEGPILVGRFNPPLSGEDRGTMRREGRAAGGCRYILVFFSKYVVYVIHLMNLK